MLYWVISLLVGQQLMINLRQRLLHRHASALGEQPSTSRVMHVLRVFAAFVIIVSVCIFLDQKAFNNIEQHAYNMRMRIRSSRTPLAAVNAARRGIVMVTLSDNSFKIGWSSNASPPPYPLPRIYHARIIRDLSRAGVKAIIFDTLFTDTRQWDRELASAARSSGKVVFACKPRGNDSTDTVQMPNPQFRDVRIGHILVAGSPESSIIDRINPIIDYKGQEILSLSMQAAALELGYAGPSPIARTKTGVKIGNYNLPLDATGCFRVSYLKSGTFKPIPYELVYAGVVPDSFFRGKIAIIGDTTTNYKDQQDTPSEEKMDGIKIHAHAIATLLQHRFVFEALPWINTAMICILAGIVCIIAVAGGLFRIAFGAVIVIAGYCMGNVWLFSERGVWMHLISPIAAAAACATCMLGERGLTTELDKQRVRWLLSRYVSPELADYIIANPEACALGGKRVTATVLFADIRGFSRISEDRSPEEVVGVLNTYFDAMTTVAFKYGGTVDKFVGDAIMVLFGVPIQYEDHAIRAVSAAIDMQSVLLDLQRKWSDGGLPVIDISIGINTGTMVAGSIGSTQRLEYTVIGDDVNTASRVTDLNNQMQTRILITKATYEAVKDSVEARGPLMGEVKGKHLVAYEIAGWKGEMPATGA